MSLPCSLSLCKSSWSPASACQYLWHVLQGDAPSCSQPWGLQQCPSSWWRWGHLSVGAWDGWPCATHPNWSDRNHRDCCQLHCGCRGQAPPAARGTLPAPHSEHHPWAARPGTAQGKTWALSLTMKVEESGWAPWCSHRLVCACVHPAMAPHSPRGRPSGQHACNLEGHVGHMLVVWQSSSLLQGGIMSFH